MRRETQESIAQWANDTFGIPDSSVRIATRANEEMAELLRAITSDAPSKEIIEEAADIVIVLYRLAWSHMGDLHEAIDKKMRRNRRRRWKRDGFGHGYHVREK